MKALLIFAFAFALGFCIIWFPVREQDISGYPGYARDFALYVAPVFGGVFVGFGLLTYFMRKNM